MIGSLVLLWIAFSVGVSLVNDKRYIRPFAAPVDQRSNGGIDRLQLSIGRAILIDELVVNLAVFGLFGLNVAGASALQ